MPKPIEMPCFFIATKRIDTGTLKKSFFKAAVEELHRRLDAGGTLKSASLDRVMDAIFFTGSQASLYDLFKKSCGLTFREYKNNIWGEDVSKVLEPKAVFTRIDPDVCQNAHVKKALVFVHEAVDSGEILSGFTVRDVARATHFDPDRETQYLNSWFNREHGLSLSQYMKGLDEEAKTLPLELVGAALT